MLCKKCGKEIRDNIRFCPACGTSVSLSLKESEAKSPSRTITHIEEHRKSNLLSSIAICFSSILLTLAILFTVFTNLHICYLCNTVYFGKSDKNFLGMDVCESCYEQLKGELGAYANR